MRRRHRQIDESVRLMSLSENVVVFSKQGWSAVLVVRIVQCVVSIHGTYVPHNCENFIILYHRAGLSAPHFPKYNINP